MEIYLKRYFWTLPIMVVILCAGLAAKATTSIIDAKLLPAEATKAGPAHVHRATHHEAAKQVTNKDSEPVTARNMFCSSCDPPPPVAASQPTSQPVADANHPPFTDLPLALVGTIVAERDRYSSATILNTQSFKSGSYSMHDEIPDAGQIVKILPQYVDFMNLNTNRVERIQLGAPPGKGTPAVAAATPTPAAPPADGPDADLMAAAAKGIKKVDDTHYDIDRALVDKILADPTAAARMARIVPSIKDGKANGFKLYAIRPGSVFAMIGMQNGDTISGINGFDMSSPDKALEVYTKVRSASSLSVTVVRRGQTVTLVYAIK